MFQVNCLNKIAAVGTNLLNDKNRYNAMRKAQLAMAVPDSAERLCNIMQKLAKKKEEHKGHLQKEKNTAFCRQKSRPPHT